MDNIGQRVKEERQFKGWSQRDLARETGVNTDTISGIETGQHEPRPSTLRKLAEGLGVEVRDLFMEPVLPKAPAREAGQPESESAARAQSRGRTSAAGHLEYRGLLEDLTEEQRLEILAGILEGRITIDEAAREVRALAGGP